MLVFSLFISNFACPWSTHGVKHNDSVTSQSRDVCVCLSEPAEVIACREISVSSHSLGKETETPGGSVSMPIEVIECNQPTQ